MVLYSVALFGLERHFNHYAAFGVPLLWNTQMGAREKVKHSAKISERDSILRFRAERSIDRMHLECGRIVMNWIQIVARLKSVVNLREKDLREEGLEISQTKWTEEWSGEERQIDGKKLLCKFRERCEGGLELNECSGYAALVKCLEKGIAERDYLIHRFGVDSRKEVHDKLVGRGHTGYLFRRKAAITRRRMIRKKKNNIEKAYRLSMDFAISANMYIRHLPNS